MRIHVKESRNSGEKDRIKPPVIFSDSGRESQTFKKQNTLCCYAQTKVFY